MKYAKLCAVLDKTSIVWVNSIWAAFNEAEKRGAVTKSRKFLAGSDGVYISVKINFLNIIYNRIDSNVEKILEVAKNYDRKNSGSKYCFEGIDNETIHTLILDLETYFRQIYSIIEFIEKFTEKTFKYINNREKADYEKFLLELNYKNKKWYGWVKEIRHSLTHHKSLWLGVTIDKPYDIIIEKTHSAQPLNEEGCLSFSDLKLINRDFIKFLWNSQKKLITYYKNL
jgi:hypothetical protein